MNLGRIGVCTPAPGLMSATAARSAVEQIEELGFGTIWYPESIGSKEALSQGALLLGWTERIVVASGIANIWARDAMATANGARALTDAFPDRFLLGIGASNAASVPLRGHAFSRPLSRMREYLDAMDDSPYLPPEPEAPVRRILAALGPRMLKLASERSIGAHPSVVPVEHTAFAREVIGSGSLLAVAQAVLLTTDRTEVRRIAGEHMSFYLARKPYRDNLERLGWSDSDMEGAGSDALLDAIVAWGDVDAIGARVQAHFDAGADHVCIQPLAVKPSDPQLGQLERLAPALTEA